MSYPSWLGTIVLTTSNNRLRFKEAAGAVGNVDLTAGSYTLRTLVTELGTKFSAFAGGGNTYTVAMSQNIDPTAAHTTITITRATGTDTFQLVIDGSETFDMDLIGFTASTANDATAKTSTQACASAWVSNDIYRRFKPFSERQATVQRKMTGQVSGVTRSDRMQSWRADLGFVNEARCFVTSALAGTQDTAEGFIERFGAGASVEFHALDVSTGSTLEAAGSGTLEATAHFSEDTLTTFDPTQVGDGVPLYDFGIVIHEVVA